MTITRKSLLLISAAIVIGSIHALTITISDWKEFSNLMINNIEWLDDASAYPKMSDRDRSTLALEDFAVCLEKEGKDNSLCFSRFTRSRSYSGNVSGSSLEERERWTEIKFTDDEQPYTEARDGVLIYKEARDGYLKIINQCFSNEGKRILIEQLPESLQSDCFYDVPGYFVLKPIEDRFSRFLDSHVDKLGPPILTSYFGLVYLFLAVGLITNYPHKGWGRLSLVAAGLISLACIIYGLNNYHGIFGVRGTPNVVLTCLVLFPLFYWLLCGMRSITYWIKAGFKD